MIERVKEFPSLTIIRHPLVQHKLTILRDQQTETKMFKELVDEIAMLMAYEATSELSLEPREVKTPLEKTTGWHISGKKLTLVPMDELARRFRIENVGHSAGVFDVEKLAWVNRHYLKVASAERLADLVVGYLRQDGMATAPTAAARAWLAGVMPMVSGAVDRLDQAPSRLHLIFEADVAASLDRDEVRAEFVSESARAVVHALAEDLAASPRLVDREQFRAAAGRVKDRTGQKGRALFHPIRVALTGEADGPELDLLAPAIDRGAELPPDSGLRPIVGCRERAAAFAEALGRT